MSSGAVGQADLDHGDEWNVHRRAVGTGDHQQVDSQTGEGAGHRIRRAVDRHMDGWLLRDQSIQGRSQVQPVDHVVDRTVADEVRTPGWESDGSDGIGRSRQSSPLTSRGDRRHLQVRVARGSRRQYPGACRTMPVPRHL